MRLNYDCVKDVLLYIENRIEFKNLSLGVLKSIDWNEIAKNEDLLSSYTEEEIRYTLIYLYENGFLHTSKYYKNSNNKHIISFEIDNLTPPAIEFINTIREPEVWDLTKEKLKSVKNITLKIITDVATIVGTAYAKSIIGL